MEVEWRWRWSGGEGGVEVEVEDAGRSGAGCLKRRPVPPSEAYRIYEYKYSISSIIVFGQS